VIIAAEFEEAEMRVEASRSRLHAAW
jgi:hypothetical protein